MLYVYVINESQIAYIIDHNMDCRVFNKKVNKNKWKTSVFFILMLIANTSDFVGIAMLKFRVFDWLIDWLIDWCLTSSEQFFRYIQDENISKFKRHGTRNKERWWVGTDNFASATGLLWTTHHEHNAHNELLHWVL